MKKYVFLTFALFVSACDSPPQPQVYTYRNNTSVAQKASDKLDCIVASENIVPQKMVISSEPKQTYCSTYSNSVSCTTFGGTVESSDQNSSLRLEVINQCMSRKGYQVTYAYMCPNSVIPDNAASILGQSVRAPVDGSCIVTVGPSGNPFGNILYPNEFRRR